MSKFIISCGGTGGHLAPGIAVGQALINAGHSVSFVISQKQVDSRLMKKYSDLHTIRAPGVAFSISPIKFAKFLRELVKAVRFGMDTIKSGNYDVVISFGGFNSLGFSIAAAMLDKPLILHEANRKPGKATRFLGRFAKRIYVPYGVKIPRKKSGQVKYAGYPVRDEIKKLPPRTAKEFFGFSPNANLLLVLGGSQGAAALNEWVNNNFERLAAENIDVLCVCGPGKHKFENKKTVGGDGSMREIKFLEFCDNMAAAMSAAELCVARAGAGTIAELARCRIPSIIVPYPFAADNHQLENANCFEKQGACVVLPQNDLHKLYAEVLRLIKDEKLKATMRKNLERVDDLNDTSKIVRDLTNVARGDFE